MQTFIEERELSSFFDTLVLPFAFQKFYSTIKNWNKR